MSFIKGVDAIITIKARNLLGDNAEKTGAAAGTPSNPTSFQKKIFTGWIKDRLDNKIQSANKSLVEQGNKNADIQSAAKVSKIPPPSETETANQLDLTV